MSILFSISNLITSLRDKYHKYSIAGYVVILDKDIEELIQKRADAKKNKDFKLADEIRQELLDKGIVLEDTRQGTKWKRV